MAADKKKKHWHCEGFVRTGCGGRDARVVDLERGKRELEEKGKAMQADLDREIQAAKTREAAEAAKVAEASQKAADKAAKATQKKINQGAKAKQIVDMAKKFPGLGAGGSPARALSPAVKKLLEQAEKNNRKPGQAKPRKY